MTCYHCHLEPSECICAHIRDTRAPSPRLTPVEVLSKVVDLLTPDSDQDDQERAGDLHLAMKLVDHVRHHVDQKWWS